MFKNILHTLIWVLIAVFLIIISLNIFLLLKAHNNPEDVPDLFGYKPMMVMSGSMEPTFSADDLIIVKKCDIDKLKVGDVVTFKEDKKYITHRISRIINGNIITKGDANTIEDDGYVNSKTIQGIYIKHYHKLGSLLNIVNKPYFLLFSIIPILFIFIDIILIKNKRHNEIVKELNELKNKI